VKVGAEVAVPDGSRAQPWASRPELWLLIALTASTLLKCWNLGHSDLTYWDEGFHAIVARNLLKHPLTFTLYDEPWLSFPFQDWGSAHIWLHKPPLAMWQIAFSFMVFGVGLVSLRLPSVLLSAGAAFLTYRIGHAAFGSKHVGLFAATLQAFNPFLMGSIHGYHYSDHIDVALIFWIEVAMYALVRGVQTGRMPAYIVSGAALGAAFLTKMFPALIVAGVACALVLIKWFMPRGRSDWRIGLRQLGAMGASAFLVTLPWMAYAWVMHPAQFAHNFWMMLGHLTVDVEQWADSWDRFLFDYLIHQVPWLYTLIVAALAWLTVRWTRQELGDAVVVLWAWGVLIPFSLSVSKPYSAILIAIPALLLALGRLLQLAWKRHHGAALTLWTSIAVSMAFVPHGRSTVIGRQGLPAALRESLAPYLIANSFVLRQLAVAALVGVVLTVATRLAPTASRVLRPVQLGVALTVTGMLVVLYGAGGWQVASRSQAAPELRPLGEAIQETLPDNATFIMHVTRPESDPHTDGYHFALMFWSDRSVYRLGSQLADREVGETAAEIEAAGGLPLLVTDRPLAAEPLLSAAGYDGFRVYPISVALTPDFAR
jgi:4-amino-4-deoxy-L-arabinose transferase-like glycosyltransferase